MEYTKIKGSEIKTSKIGLGCWAIGGYTRNLEMEIGWDNSDADKAIKGLMDGIKKGVRIFDTADVYGIGNSEKILGEAIKRAKKELNLKRKDFIIITKVGYYSNPNYECFSKENILKQLNKSLSNLNTSYIDIYFFHHLNFGENNKFLKEAIATFRELKENKKIKLIGLRGPHKYALIRKNNKIYNPINSYFKLLEEVNPDIISLRYNFMTGLRESLNKKIREWAESNNKSLIIYKPLIHGLLTKKYN